MSYGRLKFLTARKISKVSRSLLLTQVSQALAMYVSVAKNLLKFCKSREQNNSELLSSFFHKGLLICEALIIFY